MTIINISLILLVSLLPLLTFTAHVSIVHGNEAKPHSRPYMVSVQNKSQDHICDGFLISEQFVLTAAHCQKEKSEKLIVVVGAHDLKNKKEGSARIRVKSYHKHEDFIQKPLKNDLMLLKLENKIKLSKKVNFISLPKKQDKEDIKADTPCTVAGWGRSLTNGPNSDRLMEAEVKIMKNKLCFKKWGKKDENIKAESSVSKMMCVYGKGGSCNGDSGGPLVCGGIAVGVMSFGNPYLCNSQERPNVYTKISAYYDWIEKTITNVK